MPLIEAALAFAITMLALSLVCSAFVELIHRAFSMREAGLQYMLEQMFDQVLAKYAVPAALVQVNDAALPDADRAAAKTLIDDTRAAFVERMSANRAPMGVAPKATLAGPVGNSLASRFRLWNGRELASMTAAEFMERLGSIDVGADIKQANATANAAAVTAANAGAPAANAANAVANSIAHVAGVTLANATDAVLKDIVQKFDAFGREAGEYFEGRARLLSVLVAIVLAFLAHVDAVDLFKTYLRDPNARAKVIEQSQVVTAQYKASQDAIDALKKLDPAMPTAPSEDVKKAVDALQQDSLDAITKANATIKQYADLGVPLGWTPERMKSAEFSHWIWFCAANRPDGAVRVWSPDCKREDRTILLQVPTVPGLLFYLFLGGLLIGLGAPFWYDIVTGLTTLRNAGGGQANAGAPPQQQPAATVVAVAPAPQGVLAQPVTPVGAFQVSSDARGP